jgi:hypothetical protein
MIIVMVVLMAAMGAAQGLLAAWIFGWGLGAFMLVGAATSALIYMFLAGASVLNEEVPPPDDK